MPRRIRVLVVDDSMFFRAAMVKALSQSPDIEVVGEACDPYEAREKILGLDPDVITLDIEMPNMNGVEFLKVLLPQWKVPVLVVSSALGRAQDALRAGAADFLTKPTDRSADSLQAFGRELAARVLAAASAAPDTQTRGASGFNGIVAIGASTGGTQGTAKILKALPADFPGVIIVQHMPPDFTRMYAENLDRDCRMRVREAREGDVIERGVVLIAPGGNMHCEVVRRGGLPCAHMKAGEKVNGHCPSVDVLFGSVARAAPDGEAVGVILTGMGSDGARGLLEMRNRGSFTIGQDEKSCVVYGMPKEAYEMGAVARQVPLDNIASALISYVRNPRGK